MSAAKKVLNALEFGPAANSDLVRLTGEIPATVRAATASLRLSKLVHISGYQPSTTRWAAVWALGNKPDAPRPLVKVGTPAQAARAMTQARILAALEDGAKTTSELRAVTGLPRSQTYDAADALHRGGELNREQAQGKNQPVKWSLRRMNLAAVQAISKLTTFVGGVNPWTGAPT